MHIALPVDHLSNGGAERVVAHLAKGLCARGHKVDLVFLNFFRGSYLDAVPAGVRMFLLHGSDADFQAFRSQCREDQDCTNIAPTVSRSDLGRVFLREARRFRGNLFGLSSTTTARKIVAANNYIRRENPEFVLPSLPRSQNVFFNTRDISMRARLIPILHNVPNPHAYSAKHLVRLKSLGSCADHIVAVSEGVAERWKAKFRISGDRLTTICNPVVSPDIDALANAVPDHPWMMDAAIPVVLACGRLARQKDYPTLLRAFGELRRRRACRLVVIGPDLRGGSASEKLVRQIRQLDLQDAVDFIGWKDNPYAYMARASVFVLSSRYEGLPTVLIEALACGTRVVSTDCPSGPDEILENGRYGTLVPVGDAGALANALEDALAVPSTNREEARASVTERFGLENIVRRYEELMESVRERDRTRS